MSEPTIRETKSVAGGGTGGAGGAGGTGSAGGRMVTIEVTNAYTDGRSPMSEPHAEVKPIMTWETLAELYKGKRIIAIAVDVRGGREILRIEVGK